MELRPYQKNAIQKLRHSFSSGNRRVILQSATGSGKTVMASDIINSAIGKGSKILFLAHRRELIFQCSDKLDMFGVNHGVIMAGETLSLHHPVQVASVQTLIRRIDKFDEYHTNPDLIVIDECHRSLSDSFQKIIDFYPKAIVIGLTATPCRGDGRGLGELYSDMVETISVRDLTESGFLVPMKYYAPETPDLEKIKVVRGDYDQKELGKKMDKPKLIGYIFDHWKKIASDRQTIIFASSVQHSKHIEHLFCINGIDCAHIDANTPKEEREKWLSKLSSGDIQVITNCMILTEGFDFPAASCIVLARPTKSFGLYLQMSGRGLRIAEGKSDCILIDHSGCIYDHGFIDDDVVWELDTNKKAYEKKSPAEKEKKQIICPECDCVFSGSLKCSTCGYTFPNIGKEIKYYHAELKAVKNSKATMDEKRHFYSMAKWVVMSKGYSEGWAAHKFREKFGCWPKGVKDVMAREPDQEFKNYIQHLRIKYAKRKQNERAA